MRFTISNPPDSGRTLLRRAGYSEYFDKNTGKTSYSKRLGPDFFPKFHAYLESGTEMLTIDLHIDQKQASYGDGVMHSGEYQGELVERETARLRAFIANYKKTAPPKKGFLASIFGTGNNSDNW